MRQIEVTPTTALAAIKGQIFLSAAQVSARYGLTSDKNAWRWAKADPTFPKPVKLAPRCVRWKLSDLEVWEETKLQAA
jgi:prophage regulatory protein